MTDGSPSDALVIFGITGDLAHRKTLPALYRLERRMVLDVPVIGCGRTEWTDADLRAHARAAIEEKGAPDHEALGRFLARLRYIAGDASDPTTFDRLREALGAAEHPLFYLETPPSLFGSVVHGLAEADLTDGARVVIEKPFGHDLA